MDILFGWEIKGCELLSTLIVATDWNSARPLDDRNFSIWDMNVRLVNSANDNNNSS